VEGIRKLVDRWTKCIEKEGDYVENYVLVQAYNCANKLKKNRVRIVFDLPTYIYI
jgi:hypothetical protein